jgi:hypothetical protein
MSEHTAGEAYLELENCLEQLELEPITARGLKRREHASTGQRAGAHTSCPRSHPLGNSVDRAPDRGKALCFFRRCPFVAEAQHSRPRFALYAGGGGGRAKIPARGLAAAVLRLPPGAPPSSARAPLFPAARRARGPSALGPGQG